MKSSPLLDKSKAFALEIIKVCSAVKQTKEETMKRTVEIFRVRKVNDPMQISFH